MTMPADRVALVEKRPLRIYVATSWRNEYQPLVVAELREDGHEVYDFRHPAPGNDGFSWRAVDPNWQQWTPPAYLAGLRSPAAEEGFRLDMDALRSCDVCVYVMPCGVSASLEAGWAKGSGKPLAVYVPGLREPDLMVKMADLVTDDIVTLCNWVRGAALLEGPTAPREEKASELGPFPVSDPSRTWDEAIAADKSAPVSLAARLEEEADAAEYWVSHTTDVVYHMALQQLIALLREAAALLSGEEP